MAWVGARNKALRTVEGLLTTEVSSHAVLRLLSSSMLALSEALHESISGSGVKLK